MPSDGEVANFAARVNNLLMKALVSGDDAAESAKLQMICHDIVRSYSLTIEESNGNEEV